MMKKLLVFIWMVLATQMTFGQFSSPYHGVEFEMTNFEPCNLTEADNRGTFQVNFYNKVDNEQNEYAYSIFENNPIAVRDISGRSSIFKTGSSINRTSLETFNSNYLSQSFIFKYDESWDLDEIKFELSARIKVTITDSEGNITTQNTELKKEFTFCLQYVESPSVIYLDGTPMSNWNIDTIDDCKIYQLSTDIVSRAESYHWTYPSELKELGTSSDGRFTNVRPNFNREVWNGNINVKASRIVNGKRRYSKTPKKSSVSSNVKIQITINKSTSCPGSEVEARLSENLPISSSLSWIYDNSVLQILSGQGSRNAKFRVNPAFNPTSPTSTSIVLEITTECGKSTAQKSVWIGVPETPTQIVANEQFIDNNIILCTGTQLNTDADLEGNVEEYEWTGVNSTFRENSSHIYNGPSSVYAKAEGDRTYTTIRVRAKNECGYSSSFSRTFNVDCPDGSPGNGGGSSGGGGGNDDDDDWLNPVPTFPNPIDGDGFLIVNGNYNSNIPNGRFKSSNQKGNKKKQPTKQNPEMFDSSGERLSLKMTKSNGIEKLNINGLKKGIYYLRYTFNKKTYTERIIIN